MPSDELLKTLFGRALRVRLALWIQDQPPVFSQKDAVEAHGGYGQATAIAQELRRFADLGLIERSPAGGARKLLLSRTAPPMADIPGRRGCVRGARRLPRRGQPHDTMRTLSRPGLSVVGEELVGVGEAGIHGHRLLRGRGAPTHRLHLPRHTEQPASPRPLRIAGTTSGTHPPLNASPRCRYRADSDGARTFRAARWR